MFAVMGQTDAIREDEIVAYRAGLARLRIVAQKAPVRPALNQVKPPSLDIIAFGRVGEVDRTVGGDIEIIGHADGRVVLDGEPATLGLIGQELGFPKLVDTYETHTRHTDDDAPFQIKGHAQGPPADLRESFDTRIVGRRQANETPIARSTIKIVIPVENHVLRAVDHARGKKLGAG